MISWRFMIYLFTLSYVQNSTRYRIHTISCAISYMISYVWSTISHKNTTLYPKYPIPVNHTYNIAYDIVCHTVHQTYNILKIYNIVGFYPILAHHNVMHSLQYNTSLYKILYYIVCSQRNFTILYCHIVCHIGIIRDHMFTLSKTSCDVAELHTKCLGLVALATPPAALIGPASWSSALQDGLYCIITVWTPFSSVSSNVSARDDSPEWAKLGIRSGTWCLFALQTKKHCFSFMQRVAIANILNLIQVWLFGWASNQNDSKNMKQLLRNVEERDGPDPYTYKPAKKSLIFSAS